MAGLASRRKGRVAESEFKAMLTKRDWTVDADLCAGVSSADLLATSPEGNMYVVEIKNHKATQWKYFRAQAVRQAEKLKRPWMLACRIDGFAAYVVIKQGEKPVVWNCEENIRARSNNETGA